MKPQLRAQALERDGGRCQPARLGLPGTYCKDVRDERGTDKNASRIHVHHIWPLSQGGTDTLDNLVTLCRGHHGDAHRQLRTHFIVAMAAR